jgi:hypothetical protein
MAGKQLFHIISLNRTDTLLVNKPADPALPEPLRLSLRLIKIHTRTDSRPVLAEKVPALLLPARIPALVPIRASQKPAHPKSGYVL